MNYTVRTVTKAEDAPHALWEACFGPPLEGRWWYDTLEQAGLDDQFQFLYAIVERQSQPVALAPMFIADVPMELVVPPWALPILRFASKFKPEVMVQRTLFIGSPCAEEGTVGIAAGEDRNGILLALAKASRALCQAHRAPMLVWKDMPASYEPEMAGVSKASGLFRLTSYPGAEIRFSTEDKAGYFSGMKASHRQNLRRRLRKSHKKSSLNVSIVQNPSNVVVAEIFDLFLQTYDRATTRFEKLSKSFFQAAASQKEAYFILLRVNDGGAIVAFMLCFRIGDTVVNKYIGLDYSQPKDWMLYFRLLDAAVDWSLSLHATRLRSGQTGYRPKLETGHELVPLTNYGRHRNPVIHAIFALVARGVSWATLDPDLANTAANSLL